MQGKVEGYESINKDKIKEEIKSIDGISYWNKLVEWQIPKDTSFNLDLLNRTYMNAKKHRQIIL